MGGWGSWPGQGLTELRGGNWTYWNNCSTEKNALFGCYEGRRPNSYQQDSNTYTLGFGVDWAADERRVITNGTVLPISDTALDHDDARSPLVFFTTFRGG